MSASSSSTTTTFTALTYNIFAQSLGSNTIPWVMTIDDTWVAKVDAHCRKQQQQQQQQSTTSAAADAAAQTCPAGWAEVAQALGKGYTAHFHKNLRTQRDTTAYRHMRALWGARTLASQADVPDALDRTAFVEEWTVAYPAEEYSAGEDDAEGGDGSNGKEGKEGKEGGEGRGGGARTLVKAVTMAGMLRQLISDQALAEGLFAHIMQQEDAVYAWAARGPRIVEILTREWPGGVGCPSLIGLQE